MMVERVTKVAPARTRLSCLRVRAEEEEEDLGSAKVESDLIVVVVVMGFIVVAGELCISCGWDTLGGETELEPF